MTSIFYTCIGALYQALEDQCFKIKTEQAQNAIHVAQELVNWLEENEKNISPYNQYLQGLFNLWFSVQSTKGRVREEVWIRFSHFSASQDYVVFWSGLYTEAGIQGSSILSFYLTFTMFTYCWKTTYPVQNQVQSSIEAPIKLNFDEESALWYVAGYLIKSLSDKVTQSKHLYRNEILLILESFKEDDELNIDEASKATIAQLRSKEWFDTINRGGLIRCTIDFYNLAC